MAGVSVAFDDCVHTDAYARCVAENDKDAIAAMRRQYLQGVNRGIAAIKTQSQQVFGRMIPQMLLPHLGG